jgi:hypothetical protein
VNPLFGVSKLRIVISAFIWKAQRGVATFVVKLLVKRVAGRAALKNPAIDLVAQLPINALWNTAIIRTVMREVRIITLGPPSVLALLSHLLARYLAQHNKLSPTLCVNLVRVIGVCVLRRRQMHPNLQVLFLCCTG